MRVLGQALSVCVLGAILAGCGGTGSEAERERNLERQRANIDPLFEGGPEDGSSIFDLFNAPPEDLSLNVNKYLWSASLDVLSFLPVETVDPFSGVISTGWGRVNDSAPTYRATVYISGPALDARSLRVAVFRRSGGTAVAVSDQITGQIEDSILTRARQLRIGSSGRG